MGRFMIAHLQNGVQRAAILQPATAQLMHSRANTPFPAGDGMALGFYETNINGHARDRAWRRHRRLPQRPAPVPRQERRHLRVVQQRRQGRRGAARCAMHCSRTSPTATSRKRRTRSRRPIRTTPRRTPRSLPASIRRRAGRAPTSSQSSTSSARPRSASTSDGNPLIAAAKGLNGQPRKWIHIGPMVWRDADGHDLLAANVADGKASRFSFGELAPIIDCDRTPGYRSSAWILPLLYAQPRDPLPDGVLLADAAARPPQVQGASSASSGRAALGLSLEPDRGDGHPRWSSIGWIWALSMLFGDLGNERELQLRDPAALQLLSIVGFIGGFAVMLLVCLRRPGAASGAGPGKVWSILLVVASGTILYVGLVFKLIGLGDQLLMGALRLAYRVETHALSAPFRISGFVFETLGRGRRRADRRRVTGRGEAAGVYYLGDDCRAHRRRARGASRRRSRAAPTREELRALMPRGGARNAVDCALWELEAKRARNAGAGASPGSSSRSRCVTTFTLGADDPRSDGRRRAALCRCARRSRSS